MGAPSMSVTDQTSAHDPLAYLPHGVAFEDWRDYAGPRPEEFTNGARESMAAHVEAMVGFADAGAEVFDYGNSIRAEARLGGFARAFDFPGFVPAYIRPLFCEGKGPFRWAALSGDPADIAATDRAVLDLFPQNESLHALAADGRGEGAFPGPARPDLLARYGERNRPGYGQRDCTPPGRCRRRSSSGATTWTAGSVASPYRETEARRDGSDAIADWPLLNAMVNVASGALVGDLSTTAAAPASAGPSTPARSAWLTARSWPARSLNGSSPTTRAWALSGTSTPGTSGRPRSPPSAASGCRCWSSRDPDQGSIRPGLGRAGGIGRDEDTGGYRRFAWTGADLELRAWFAREARQRGMACEQDRNGNQWAWWGDPAPGAVVTGSHLDSVPDGGAYDGPLGVLSGFLAVDELRERGVRPARPVAVACFADEEGARFGVACVGSRLLTGALDPDAARGLRDGDGVTLAEAMRQAGADPAAIGRDEETLARIGAFVELHVEQGRALAAPVGVATGIWPHGRWRLRLRGEANHAGTTRLADRRDPMLPYAAAVLAAREAAGRAGALATFGKITVVPGGANAIASAVDGWLDVRAPGDAAVAAVVAEITAAAESSAVTHGVDVTVSAESYTPGVHFDGVLRDRVAAAAGGLPALPTGACHDACILSARVPAAMLFVRNPTGVSHSPSEFAEAADCVTGVRALGAVLEELACGS